MTVLSIDFDICMWQDIELYNNLVNSYKTIDGVIEKFPALQNVRFDAELYNRLTELVALLARKLPVNKIHFINSHEEIVPLLRNGKHDNKVINIDHHHDIRYHLDDDAKPSDFAGCANWVKFLYDNNMIEKYFHVGDFNSTRPMPEDAALLTEFIPIHESGLNHFSEEVDELCICLSPAWVPAQYHGLFEAWATMLGVMKNTKYKYK